MATEIHRTVDEAQIHALVDDWVKAIRARNIDAVMAHYAPDVVVFLPVPPLEYVGADAYRKNTEAWLSSWQGPLEYEYTDVHITAGDDVAVWHSLSHISGTTVSRKKSDMWLRVTVCFRKMNGRWLVTHEHVSVPFDMKTGQALVDLKP